MELQKIITDEIDFYQQKLQEAQMKLKNVFFEEQRQQCVKVIDQKITDKYSLYHGDCIEVIKGLPSNSIHYSIFSPPFSSLFTYSNSLRDLGNGTDDEFKDHFEFLVPELYRVMMPGRLISMHCADIPAMKERDGYIGLKDFPGDLIRIFQKYGFIYHSRVLIKKNELIESQRTRALGLAHKQVVKDSAMCRNGSPDYVVTMRKPGENPEPISREKGFEEYVGGLSQPKERKHNDLSLNRFSQKVWQRYAASIWLDIRQTNTLNVRMGREKEDERHICPLQLDVITRCLELWSNLGDTVLSPFAGIGSEGYQSLLMGRKFIGIELKEIYYTCSIKNLKVAERKLKVKGFF